MNYPEKDREKDPMRDTGQKKSGVGGDSSSKSSEEKENQSSQGSKSHKDLEEEDTSS